MANAESGSPLRRWRPFYGAFVAIDDVIEASGEPRAAYLDMSVQIVKMLRAAEDDGVAEQLCALLDDAMAESLETMRKAPVPHRALASTDLASSVGVLRNHGSARIRGLASDVVRDWTAATDSSIAIATAVKKELDKLSGERIQRQGISTVVADGNARGPVVHAAAAAEIHEKKLHVPPAKMMVPAAATAAGVHKRELFIPPTKMLPTAPVDETKHETKKAAADQSKKMEATKRKLREGYEEAKRIKHQHTIQKIDDKDAAKMFEQKQRKMHPIARLGRPATCRTSNSSGVSRSLLPSLQMI